MKRIVFLWDNIGPMHHDRLEAAAAHFQEKYEILCIEVAGKSYIYNWETPETGQYKVKTLFPDTTSASIGIFENFTAIFKACREAKADYYFLSGYEKPHIFLIAVLLRLTGKKPIVMINSKFIDHQRHLAKEFLKSILYLPYCGALSGSPGTTSYLRFLGFKKRPVALGFNTLSIAKFQNMAQAEPAPAGIAFADRHFTIVARLVPEKNLGMALEAYHLYRQQTPSPRPLHIYGNGPEQELLEARIRALNLAAHVTLHGFIQIDTIAKSLSRTLALLLPSTFETFGNVVMEAQALAVPVILTDICGSACELVRNGRNGFVISTDDPQALANLMTMLCTDKALWEKMCAEIPKNWPLIDACRFAKGVESLIKDTA